MCQALSEGGRRCPIHRHDSHAVNMVASHLSALNTRQVDNLFRELRREGRHSEWAAPFITALQGNLFENLRTRAAGTTVLERVNDNLTQAADNPSPDAATMYAQTKLIQRATTRGQNLTNRLREVAQRTGLTETEVRAKFDSIYDGVDVTYGAGNNDDEYTPTARARAVAADLPYDRASVVALEKLYALPAAQTAAEAPIRRVRVFYAPNNAASHIHMFGYDEGRLEISFKSDPDRYYAYHDVPETVWNNLAHADNPGSVYARYIRGNDDYMYDSAEAADADANAVQCASCGQFRAAVHSCPEREVREQAAADPAVPVSEIPTALALAQQTVRAEAAAEQPDVEQLQQPMAELDEEERATARSEMSRAFEATVLEINAMQEAEELNRFLDSMGGGDNDNALVDYDVQTVIDTAQEEPTEATQAADTVRPTDGIVVPAPEIPAQDLAAIRPEVQPPTYASPAGEQKIGNFSVIDPATPTYAAYAPTADGQYQPQRFDAKSLVAYSTEQGATSYNRHIVNGGAEIDIYYSRGISEADLATVKDAPSNMRFVFTRNSYGEVFKPTFAYDENRFQGQDGMDGVERHVYQIVTKVSRDANPHEDLSRTNPERDEALAKYNRERMAEAEAYRTLIAQGTAVVLTANASASRRFVIDANLGKQPAVTMAPAAEIRNAIRENKVVIMDVGVKFGRDAANFSGNYVDDQGYSVSIDSQLEITGRVAVRRGADGTIEVINSQRELKCNCYDYRRKAYCRHIGYMQRHIGNAVQQSLPDSMGAGRTIPQAVNGTRAGAAGVSRLMTAPLRRRNDVEVVAGQNAQPDTLRVKLVPNTRNTVGSHNFNNAIVVPTGARIADAANPTVEEIQNLRALHRVTNGLQYVTVPPRIGELRTALRRSDIEIEVGANFYDNGEAAVVSGTMTIAQQAQPEDTIVARGTNLKCTCADYRENYDCRHVRLMADQAHGIMQATGRGTPDRARTNSLYDTLTRMQSHIQREGRIEDMMNSDARRRRMIPSDYVGMAPMTREGAIRAIEEQAEQDRIRRAEEEENRRQRQLRWEEENRERLQREAAERREQNAPVVEANNAYRERMHKRWTEVEAGYSTDENKFYDDYKAVLKRKRDGETVIPFRTENVTDGICADEPGARQFGIELEFDIKPGVDRREALRKIGQELYEAGLTNSSAQGYYHSAAASGWAKWSFEQDCTVDAELVSPLMKDTPEDWAQLQKALDIIKKHGGSATTRTGSHVHVSTASYETSSAKHVELLRTINNNDDILYRMASSPNRGRHRGMQWCAPNVNDREGDIDAEIESAQNIFGYAHSSHNVGVNFQSTFNPEFQKSNVEFRMWDGTLDAATIQQQVVMSAAITDYAERQVIANKGSKKNHEKRQTIGQGRMKEGQALETAGVTSHTVESFKQANGHVAEFFDSIFRRQEDREAAMSLFAVTNWQTN